MTTSDIPENKWKQYLHSQLTLEGKQKVMHLLQDRDSQYEEISAVLMGCASMTFAATAEAIFTADKGKLLQLPLRQATDKMKRWVNKMLEESETVRQAADKVTVGVMRSFMVPELKTYLDTSNATDEHNFLMTTEEWERSQPDKRNLFRHTSGYGYRQGHPYGDSHRNSQSQRNFNSAGKKLLTCFYCGKVGHLSRDCRSRTADMQKQTAPSQTQSDVNHSLLQLS